MISSSFARISMWNNTLCRVINRPVATDFHKFSQFSVNTILKPNSYFRISASNLNFSQEFSIEAAPVANATVCSLLNKWCSIFEEKKISQPRESIQFILAHYLKSEKVTDLYEHKWSNKSLTGEDVLKINEMCDKRLEKWPIQYILGEWQFRRLNLKLQPPVFIPWFETELLPGIVSPDIKENNVKKILEFCCGSGAIVLALLDECPNITAVAIDQSQEACALTMENAHRNNLSERITVHNKKIPSDSKEVQSLFPEKEGGFDVIVSNPPYMLTKEIPELTPEIVLYEDHRALNGGEDGLTLVNLILHVTATTHLLKSGGRLYLEVNPAHPAKLAAQLGYLDECTTQAANKDETLTSSNNLVGKLKLRKIHKDLAGLPRFVEIVKV